MSADWRTLPYPDLVDLADELPEDDPRLPELSALIDQARNAYKQDRHDPTARIRDLLRRRQYEVARLAAEEALQRDERDRKARGEPHPTRTAHALAGLHNAALDARRSRSAAEARRIVAPYL